MTSSTLSGVELSLFSSRVQAICDEMGVALRRSAFSPNTTAGQPEAATVDQTNASEG